MANYCLVVPLLPGKANIVKKFEKENGSGKEHDEFYKIAGITREQIWIQRSFPGSGASGLEIVSLETLDPARTLAEFSTSDHPWAIKFRKYALEVFGMDLATELPPL